MIKKERSLLNSLLTSIWTIASFLYKAWVMTKVWALLIMGFMGLPALPLSVAVGVFFLLGLMAEATSVVKLDALYASKVAEAKEGSQQAEEFQILKHIMEYVLSPMVTSSMWLGAWIWSLVF